MPIIEVSLLAGRPAETKRALLRELTDAAERVLGVRRDSIRVILREVPPEHWGVGGHPINEPPPGESDKP
jgi:4-oxalocrotonate tautomerase